MLLSIIKYFIKSILYSINSGKFFPGVDFYNSKSIQLDQTVIIEKGTRLNVFHKSNTEKNIFIEKNCWIGRDVEIQSVFDSKIIIKSNTSIQDRCKIIGDVEINKDSILAPDVYLSSGNHIFSHKPEILIKKQDKILINNKAGFQKLSKKIIIEEDCWIGKSVIIKSGIVISRGAIIGANSFVNKNIPPYEIWAGNPAKCIKKRLDFSPPLEINFSEEKYFPYFYSGFDHNDISNGFLSENNSTCILSKVNVGDKLSFSFEIINPGIFSIYINNSLIYNQSFNKKISKIEFQEIIKLNFDNCNNPQCEHLRLFFQESSIIRFNFSPFDKSDNINFKLFNIKINLS